MVKLKKSYLNGINEYTLDTQDDIADLLANYNTGATGSTATYVNDSTGVMTVYYYTNGKWVILAQAR